MFFTDLHGWRDMLWHWPAQFPYRTVTQCHVSGVIDSVGCWRLLWLMNLGTSNLNLQSFCSLLSHDVILIYKHASQAHASHDGILTNMHRKPHLNPGTLRHTME